MHPTIIKIDTQQFKQNLRALRALIGPQVKLCLPVKANGYGHGLVATAQAAAELVDYLAVACLNEGKQLRLAQITKPILVLGAMDREQIAELISLQLDITVTSLTKAQEIAEYCAANNQVARVHLKIDTGMNRIGVRVASAEALINYVLANPCFELIGVYSHFAASDTPNNPLTAQQIAGFKQVVNYIKQLKPAVICHLANSAGVCFHPDSYFDMVRPGIVSYGYLPTAAPVPRVLSAIKPCFSLISKVAYFKVVAAGQGISYNHRYQLSHQSRIITIPIGYGDGYRRALSNRGHILVNGHKYTISGTICMDMLLVDIGPHGEAYVGDEVVLIGTQGAHQITATELAHQLDSIVYEILVGFTERIPRLWV